MQTLHRPWENVSSGDSDGGNSDAASYSSAASVTSSESEWIPCNTDYASMSSIPLASCIRYSPEDDIQATWPTTTWINEPAAMQHYAHQYATMLSATGNSLPFADAAANVAATWAGMNENVPQLYPVAADSASLPPFVVDPSGLQVACQHVLAQDAHAKQKLIGRKQRPKRHVCEYCSVAFSNNGQLQGHIRSHTGERPFGCVDCGKAFTRNEELTRHKRIHSGEKPFACERCPKRFGRRDHLKKHMLTHQPPNMDMLQYQLQHQLSAEMLMYFQQQQQQMAIMMYSIHA